MVYKRIHKSSPWSPSTQAKSSPFASRPFTVQAQHNSHTPPTQQEIENEAFDQNKFEAFGLQLKEKYGAITPVEQERLGVLQAKMQDFWAAQRASRFRPNLADIALHAPGQQVSAPVEPRFTIQPYRADVPPPQQAIVSDRNGRVRLVPGAFQARIRQNLSAPPIQAKLTIGPPNDKYEQEADRVASQVVQQIHAPASGEAVQRVIEGADPVADSDILDPAHVNDLLYGLANYRGATMASMNEQAAPKRTIDQYNASVGINGNIINGHQACIGVYLVRNALKNPAQWRTHLRASLVDYPNDQGDGVLSNEQKWMTFLVREKNNIGLWDLGNTNRPVIGRNIIGGKKRGEAEGLTRIKSKRRFEKNMHEDDAGTFSKAEVHKMLSFGTDTDAAEAYYKKLNPQKQQGLNRWIQNAFWRRTSKLGIDFATSDIGLNARVHFNLTTGIKQQDGSWQAKLWGILNDIAEDQGTRKITESEWRYIMRMMEKNPELLEYIIPYSEHQ